MRAGQVGEEWNDCAGRDHRAATTPSAACCPKTVQRGIPEKHGHLLAFQRGIAKKQEGPLDVQRAFLFFRDAPLDVLRTSTEKSRAS